MVSTLTATFAVITPLFGGGADQTTLAELRPPSIKGVLRFWWRALAWSRDGDLGALRSEEARNFGSACDGDTGGRASFLLRVTVPSAPRASRPPEVLRGSDGTVIGNGARYFGYGLMAAFPSKKAGTEAGQLSRPCLLPPLEFTVDLVSRGAPEPTLVDALKLMGLLGGLGSRTRRGWGSLTLTSLKQDKQEIWQQPGTPMTYRNKIRAILSVETLRDDEPPYSAFCKHTRIDIVGKDSDPLRLLNRVGEEMLRYRSWGRPDKYGINRVGNIEVERNFEDDHDWFKASERASGLADGRPRRAIFGLPHNYSQQFQVTAKGFDRRASPLLVHVHRLTEQSYIAVLIVMRSAFLPKDVTLKVTNRRTESYPDAAPDWTVLDTFIDGRSTSKNAPYFPDRLKVLP
ncbi:type III-B CRISPR module RAMP protein Cmr1 [Defluviicoccus vanus]|uniref:Type III-B CRISPR module RAMP protein Cmr1 n=1 Tax=Defluviicoccus vanus TaxID=111831 RepID=A0A7H1N081_9PROT|nr:type III-B CRISPR module RAMP protein Cmr1 [Defluviicoccus vanus]QNT69117.1 type III-B CRISPR module RAMP protein Cmr1 [Defluviicoccus vanus]